MSLIFSHLFRILNNAYGYLLIAMTFVLNLLQPEWFCFAVVFLAILFDLFWGVCAALKLHNFVLSKLIRDTFSKIGGYAFSLVGVFLIERILHDSGLLCIKATSALAAACELWSMSASILIVYPNFPFLKILRLQLKGEIASKTGKNIDNILKDE